MSLRQLSTYVLVVLVLALMFEVTDYPATPLVFLTELTIKPANLECRAGCQLQLPQLVSVNCLALNQGAATQEKMMAKLGPVEFLCSPGPEVELASDTRFMVDKLDCQFSDEAFDLVIPSSCHLVYSLALSEEAGPPSASRLTNYGLRLFLSLLLVTFTCLALRDYITNQARAAGPPPPTIPVATQVLADHKEIVEVDAGTDRSRREERRFRQNHSAIREKSRARSRSRKRVDLMK